MMENHNNKFLNEEPEVIDIEDDAEMEYFEEDPYRYKDSTYEIISKVAYLIGVSKRIFENENQPPKLDVYERLDQDKNARIIRHLCIIRNSIERGYKQISNKMRFEMKSIMSLPECVPAESVQQLSQDGISFYKASHTQLFQHIIEINRIISDRINNCKSLFPVWLNWDYLKRIFVMPNGLTKMGTEAASNTFYTNLSCYPYKMYINWVPQEQGNILYNDKKFVTLLYEWNGSEFTDYSKVSDAGIYVKGSIYDYIEDSKKVAVVVDCENSDPYKLSATFRNLDEAYTKKISSIILFDDVHTASAWRILEQYTSIPVQHVMTERVKENKSLVDIKLTARACQEHYVNNVDSFVIVSSDSDYWGLIESLPQARFLVMVERDSCSQDFKNALANSGIFYCYIDDFYSANAEDVKYEAIFKAMYQHIDKKVQLNINEMVEEALKVTRVEMPSSERNQFIAKYVKTMQMRIDANGDVILQLKSFK